MAYNIWTDTCKMRNETKRNEINRNEIHRNETKWTETKRSGIIQNEIKPILTKRFLGEIQDKN
jgi:mannosyltransferase OCH1-like enzyme